MKKTAFVLLCLLLAVLMLPLLALPARAAVENGFQYRIESGLAIIEKYVGSDTDVTVPDTLGGHLVNTIGSEAFKGSAITRVFISQHVKVIGESAFEDCSSLTAIEGAKAVDTIGKRAFLRCKSLETWAIPADVKVIDEFTFYMCDNLTELTISAKLTAVNDAAFNWCDNLTIVYYGGSRTQWNDITIGEANYPLYEATIRYASGSVLATGSCSVHGDNTWTLEKGDKCRLTIEGIDDMIDYAYYEGGVYAPWYFARDQIEEIVIGSGVTGIGWGAFYQCKNAVKVTIPSTVQRIGDYAFCECYKLVSVTIPAGVKTISAGAFHCCTSMKSVTIPASVTSIGDYAFFRCEELTGVAIPAGLVNLGNGVFDMCEKLTSIVIPDGVPEIGYDTFTGCSSLREVRIPASVSSIGQYAFFGLESLTDIWFGGTQAQWDALQSAIANDNYSLYEYELKIHFKPAITQQPKNVSAAPGGSVKFTVKATGDNLSYQWQVCEAGKTTWKNSPATGNKTATLTVPATADRNGYKYRCIVTNKSAKVISSAAALTVAAAPKITTQPASVTKAAGSGNAAFKVVASGTGLTYQWQVCEAGKTTWKDSPATGNKTATLTVPVTAARNGYKYRCVVKNSSGTVTSSAATLTVTGAQPVIASQPANVTMKASGNATFKVTVTGTGLSYQWQYCEPNSSVWKNSPATGNKTATLTIPATAERSGNKYRCIITNSGGSVTSSAATLTVLAITTQPKSVTKENGTTATFKVTATGTGLTYQWQVSTNGGSTWSDSPATGNKTATLTVPVTPERDGYKYRCIVKLGSLSVTSSAATLSVTGY